MKLFIDIGNTNTKIKWQNTIIIVPTKANYDSTQLYNLLPPKLQKSKILQVWVCSVVPQMLAITKKMLQDFFQPVIQEINYQSFPELQLDVKNPAKVGNDLIALGAFAMSQNKNVIIVNLGTATTISHIKNHKFKGTIIAPGLTISWNSLIKEASALSLTPLNLKASQTLGRDTKEAISLGVIKGHAYMIEGLVNNIDPQAHVIISGGNAEKIQNLLKTYQYITQATLRGIEVIAHK